MLKGLFGGPSTAELGAEALYRAIVAQSREPAFYRDLGVPDSLDGRFELIVLHVTLVIDRLRRGGAEAEELAQLLFDALFRDMDINLREMGVGDIGVAHRVKAMAQAFFGRARAYEAVADPAPEPLEQALQRNLFGTVDAEPGQLSAIAGYVREVAATLAAGELDALARGRVSFPPPPAV